MTSRLRRLNPRLFRQARHGRGTAATRLLLMPADSTSETHPTFCWVLSSGADATSPAGYWTTGEPVPENWLAANTKVVLVVPPESVTRFELPAPRKLKREEWPLLVNQHRGDEGQEAPLALARLGYTQGRLVLVGVARHQLQTWQAAIAEAGCPVTAWAPAFLGQPEAPPDALCALPAGDDWMLSWRDHHADGPDGRTHWLTWPRQAALPPALAQREWYQPLDAEDDRSRLAFIGQHLPVQLPRPEQARDNNRPARRRGPSLAALPAWLPWRRGLLVALLAAVHVGLTWWQGQATSNSDASSGWPSRFITSPAGPAEAQRRLAERGDVLASLGRRQQHIEAHLSGLPELPAAATLQALSVAGQELRLEWATTTLTAAQLDSLRPQLAGLGELKSSADALQLAISLSDDATGGNP